MATDAGSTEQTFVNLEAGSEWRFELESDENIAVRVQSPDPVYINSEELPPVTWYPLHRYLKSSIYSPNPARLEVTSLPVSQYSSSSTTQPALVSLHLALERLRIIARREGGNNGQSGTQGRGRGPRVMILGPPCSGKTTVLKNLVNMALGSGLGWTPGVIGLDPASPSNLIPGSLSLSTPNHPIPTHHLAHPLGAPPTSVPANTLAGDVPTVGWWYGHMEPSTKGADVWKKLVDAMGQRWKERCEKDPLSHASGAFIDTSSAFSNPMLGTRKDDPKARYSLVAHAITTFDVDTILVLGHEKLSIDLTRLFPQVQVIRIPKSGGVVDLDESYRQIVAAQQVRGYFYGEPELPKEIANLSGRMVGLEGGLSPYSFQIGWERLSILRVGEENAAPSTALPLGSSRILSPTRLTKVDPSGPAHLTRLLNTVLAVVHLIPADRIRKAPKAVAGVKEEPKATIEGVETVKVEEANGAPAIAQGEAGEQGAEGSKKEEGEGDGEGAGGGEGEGEEARDEDVVEMDDGDEDEVPYVEEVGWREITGFIVITAIDTLRKKYTILSPSPGKLPSTVAIAGSIEWVDSA